jgi:branched-chain amino acid transport system permease protein
MDRGRRAVVICCLVGAAWALAPAAGAQTPTTVAPAGGAATTTTTAVTPSTGGPTLSTVLTAGGEPIEGAEVTVSRDGEEVASGTSDEEGRVTIRLDEPGRYDVALDLDSLPEGIEVEEGARSELRPIVQSGGVTPIVFRLVAEGSSGSSAPGTGERLAGLFASGLRFGLVIAVASVGLSLIFGTTGLTNFAHGEMVAFGAIATWYFNDPSTLGLSLVLAAVAGVVASGLFGASLELGLFRPLRRRGMSELAIMVVSIGLAFALRYLFAMVFAANPRQYAQYAAQGPSVDLGLVSLRPKDLIVIGVSLVVLVLVGLFLQRARLGTAIRAVSDNRDLAESSGIDVQRVILTVWILSGALAGLGGLLLGLTETVSWNMGQRVLLVMFAAVVLGGLGTTFGAMAGGLLVGIVSDLSTFWLDSDLKIVVALAALVVVLLFRPTGIFGVRERTA